MRRPVLSVTSASFRPRPSFQTRFSFGTFTFVKRTTPFSMALRPMKWQRVTTSTPGKSFSTTKAEIFLVSGWRAITMKSSAIVPFVVQSLSPFRT